MNNKNFFTNNIQLRQKLVNCCRPVRDIAYLLEHYFIPQSRCHCFSYECLFLSWFIFLKLPLLTVKLNC